MKLLTVPLNRSVIAAPALHVIGFDPTGTQETPPSTDISVATSLLAETSLATQFRLAGVEVGCIPSTNSFQVMASLKRHAPELLKGVLTPKDGLDAAGSLGNAGGWSVHPRVNDAMPTTTAETVTSFVIQRSALELAPGFLDGVIPSEARDL